MNLLLIFFESNIIVERLIVVFKYACSAVVIAVLSSPVCLAKATPAPAATKMTHNQKVILSRYSEYYPLIKEASRRSGMPEAELAAFVKIESTFNKRAYNGQFGAKGLLQHLDSTWRSQKRMYGKKVGVSRTASVYNPKASLFVGSAALAHERNMLAKQAGVHPSQIKSGDLYLSHMYGYDRALKIIKAPKGTKISKFVKINPSSGLAFYKNRRIMTTHEFRAAANSKLEREKRLFLKASDRKTNSKKTS